MGVVPSSSFVLSIRPSTSLSAPPCTPMPSSFLRNESLENRSVTRRELREDSWPDPVTQWDITAGSMASLASESMLPNAVAKFAFNKPDKNRPTSLISTVDYQNPREVYENPRGMTLSDDALHEPHDSKVELHLNSSSGERSQTLPFRGVSGVKKGRVQSHELLNVDSSMCTDLRKSLAHPVVCLLVLGGKTRNHTEMGRTLDFWRCDIDPGKGVFFNAKCFLFARLLFFKEYWCGGGGFLIGRWWLSISLQPNLIRLITFSWCSGNNLRVTYATN